MCEAPFHLMDLPLLLSLLGGASSIFWIVRTKLKYVYLVCTNNIKLFTPLVAVSLGILDSIILYLIALVADWRFYG